MDTFVDTALDPTKTYCYLDVDVSGARGAFRRATEFVKVAITHSTSFTCTFTPKALHCTLYPCVPSSLGLHTRLLGRAKRSHANTLHSSLSSPLIYQSSSIKYGLSSDNVLALGGREVLSLPQVCLLITPHTSKLHTP